MSKQSKMSVDFDQDSGYDLGSVKEELGSFQDRSRISYATNLNAGLKEKLKTISHAEDVSMADLVNHAVRSLVENLEEENGEYEVPDVFKVQDS